jgi:HTH-type transcriptional regulator/antitoxin HipB
MPSTFPIRFPDQLRQHLRAMRKKQSLTQAQLGALVGVSQARIAEIEANPGLVSFEQLMKLLSVLRVSVILSEDVSPLVDAAAASPKVTAKPRSSPERSKSRGTRTDNATSSTPRTTFVVRPKKGSW